MREENRKPPARSLGGVINRGLFASTSVTLVADDNSKRRVGICSYPASPCKLLCTAVLAFPSPFVAIAE